MTIRDHVLMVNLCNSPEFTTWRAVAVIILHIQPIDEGGRSMPHTVETSLGPSTSSSGTRRSGPNSAVETSLGPASSGTSKPSYFLWA